MIPQQKDISFDDALEIVTDQSKTFRLNIDKKRVNGMVDGLDAVKQAVCKILITERYEHEIYSWNYGIELNDLIGCPSDYAYPEIERQIREALMQDERITEVNEFHFNQDKGTIGVEFNIETIFGSAKMESGVTIHV